MSVSADCPICFLPADIAHEVDEHLAIGSSTSHKIHKVCLQNMKDSGYLSCPLRCGFIYAEVLDEPLYALPLGIAADAIEFDLLLLPQHSGRQLLEAVESRNLFMIQHLLEIEPMNHFYVYLAAIRASRLGYLDVIEKFIASGKMTQNIIGLAVVNSIAYSFDDITLRLLSIQEIDQQIREEQIICVVLENRINILYALLDNGNIREIIKEEALIIAAEKGLIEIVAHLLNSGAISDDAKAHALVCANLMGFEEITKLISSERY